MKARITREIVLALAQEHPQDMSIGDLTKKTGHARDTVKKYLDALEERDYVKESRSVGRARMFALGPKLTGIVEAGESEAINDLLQLTE